MRRDAQSYLRDVIEATDAITRFVQGVDEARYQRDDMLHSAVERKFVIIGEALSQLSKLDPQLAARVIRCREVVAFRNILIHGYAAVQHDRVWDIAQRSLPALRQSVAALLQELSQRE